MKTLFFLLFCSLSLTTLSQKDKKCFKIKSGDWHAVLQLDEQNALPFGLRINKKKKEYTFTVVNGEEEIKLASPHYSGDSIVVSFPYFNSELVINRVSKKLLVGNWYNHNKKGNYHIPFKATYSSEERFSTQNKLSPVDVNGRWEIEFEPNTSGSYPAVGIFKQSDRRVSGTFLTETGDYRFLAGNATADSLYLSCFDGSHAFLFKSRISGDSVYGEFFSGNHWRSEWQGKRNESFQIKSPEELTYIKESAGFQFISKTLNGDPFEFPNESFQNKVTIIQIMGTWCPNCLDETIYFQELYNKYGTRGLEIIAIGYEVGNDFDSQAKSIERLKQKLGIQYTMLVGGAASKKLASEDFSMLNEVISFPTSIFIGKDGTVRRVHTGFNGPGTGDYYQEYIKSTDSLIQSLLEE